MEANNFAGASERRLTSRGRETRQRIVTTAAELIFDHGIADTTLEDIRAAAGVSGSQVYHYFEDKQALVRAVIGHQTETVFDFQGEYLDRLDSVEGLRRWRDAITGRQRQVRGKGGGPIGAIGAEVAETDEVARLAVAGSFDRWAGRIEDGIRAMYDRGDLPSAIDPGDLALALLASLQGGLFLAQIYRR
jgi:TetR/AcrR family transcriptional regulator, transcriptional repressor for nem operon